MKQFYFAFIIALFLDLLILPNLGISSWLPRFTLTLLPFAFLFANKRALWIFFTITSFVFWLTTNINLGLVVFSFGSALFFEKWVILKMFHKDAWQILLISSLGVVIFGLFLGLISIILTSEASLFSNSFILSFVLTALVSIGATYIFKKNNQCV